MKINALYKILSSCLVLSYLRGVTFLCAFLLLGFNGYGQTVSFSSASGFGAEDVGTGIPTLLVDGEYLVDSSVTLTPGGTATGGGADYTLASTTITIPAGTYSNTAIALGLTITGDAVVEPDETITLGLGGATGDASIVAPTSTTYTIMNDDGAATVAFSSATGSGAENAGTGIPTLLVNGTVVAASSVTLTPGGTATGGGTDYTLASTTITIPAGTYGNTAIALGLTITGDAVVEPDETITLGLGGATGDASIVAPTSTTYTIMNDDSFTVSITANDATASETGSATGQFTVDLGATNTTGSPIVVNFNIATGGTNATNVTDYANIGTSVSIANGQSTGLITVTPVDDGLVEGPETVILTLAAGTGYAVAGAPDNTATVTIADNDSYIASITANDATASETGSATGQFTVDLGATNTTGSPIVVNFNIATGGTNATNVTDYANIGTSVSIANGQSTGLITVTPVDDGLVEGPETVILTLAAGTGYAVAGAPDNTATVTIADNDSYIASITANDATASETGSATGQFTVDLGATNTTGSPIVVNFNIATGGTNATNVTDYANIGTSVSIANGQSAGLITITPVDDGLVEGPETVILTLAAGTGYSVAAAPNNTATVTIADNDSYIASITANDATATEAGTTTGQFTVNLGTTNTTGSAIVVNYTIATGGSNATNTTDYATLGGSVSIGNNQQTGLITVTPVDDAIAEGSETVILTLTTGAGYSVAAAPNNTATVTIADNDSVGVTVSTISGNTTEAGGTATFTLVLDSQPTGNVTIPLSSNNTAEGTLAVSTVVFTPSNWNVAQTVTVTGVDDIVVDGDISYAIVTGNVTSSDTGYDALNAGSVADVSVVNIDDDTAGISISDVTVNEGDGTATFTVILNRGVLFGTSVKYETANNTASAGSDYVSKSGTLSFLGLNGETKTVVIDILEDVIAEGTESFYVNLSNATGFAQIAKAQGVGTITDNDNCIEAPLINDTSTIFCAAFTQDLDDYTDTTIPSGFELVWSSNSDFSVTGARLNTSIIDFEATFYGFLYNQGTGCVSPPLEVTLVRNEPPEILSTTPATICGPGIATISATVSAGGSLFWYALESSVDSLEEGSSFSTSVSGTTTYYVEAFANGCFSEREAVTVTVNDLVDPGTTTATSACSLSGGGAATTIDLDTTRSGGDTGVWSIVGTPPSTVTIGADNIVDFEGVVDGDYIFRFTTDSAVSPCVDESVDVTISVTTCTMDSDGDSIIDRDEIALGLDPNDPDTDGDGIDDGAEVGPDVSNPIDTDNDGIIDALDSNILDSDNDGVVDQLDPANDNPCIPNISDACQIDLGIEKVVDRESVLVGREVVFTVTLTNLSQIMVTNVAVNDLVSPATGFQYVSSSSSKGIYDPVAGVWQLEEVLADEVNTLTITVIVPEVGTFQNTAAIVDSFPEDSNAANNIASATVEVTPRSTNECGFLFNQISPNGDGVNDSVYINCVEQYPNNTLQIFDRYGNEVFSVNGYDNSWMGTGKNGDLPKGTYFYILDLGDGTEVRKGWIQIIR